MGRMGDAWDVANAVLLLVSAEAKYITGYLENSSGWRNYVLHRESVRLTYGR